MNGYNMWHLICWVLHGRRYYELLGYNDEYSTFVCKQCNQVWQQNNK